MGDALAREHRQLLSAVDRFGGLREHLAQPIWGDGDERVRGELAHARAPPAGEIGDDDVLREMQLGRVEDQPTPGPAATAIERTGKVASEDARGAGVRHSGTRRRVEHAADDLTDLVRWQGLEIGVGRAGFGRSRRHGMILRTRWGLREPRFIALFSGCRGSRAPSWRPFAPSSLDARGTERASAFRAPRASFRPPRSTAPCRTCRSSSAG